MRYLLIACLVAVVVAAPAAFAQAPVEPVDLRADTVLYDFPSPDSLHVTARFVFYNVLTTPETYNTDLVLRLDGAVVYSTPMTLEVSTTADCGNDPDCNDQCVVVKDGVPQFDHCRTWHTWTGPGCNPSDPAGTCDPIDVCGCGVYMEAEAVIVYSGEDELVLEVDSVQLVNEADETNNTTAMCLGPVPTRRTTWGAIKALFGL